MQAERALRGEMAPPRGGRVRWKLPVEGRARRTPSAGVGQGGAFARAVGRSVLAGSSLIWHLLSFVNNVWFVVLVARTIAIGLVMLVS